jgi:hypothetical protein
MEKEQLLKLKGIACAIENRARACFEIADAYGLPGTEKRKARAIDREGSAYAWCAEAIFNFIKDLEGDGTMRKRFINLSNAPTRADAEALAPWACAIVEADGGWIAFESAIDALIWEGQQ